jgi:hypothetical protein
MIKEIGFLAGVLVSTTINAKATIDVYGVSPKEAQAIIHQHGKELAKIYNLVAKYSQGEKNHSSEDELNKLRVRRDNIREAIKKQYGYLFVDFQMVVYPDTHTFATTIEVVDKDHPERMRFVQALPSIKQDPPRKITKKDVIDDMEEYQKKSVQMVLNNQISGETTSCPVYHCQVNFDHPSLKPYLKEFNEAAIDKKALILNTLYHDKSADRRAAAAYLTAHFKDPQEIVVSLVHAAKDRDDGVRNNAMRVLSATLAKWNAPNLDLKPFIELLDSPYTSDRNKALIVLLNAATSKKVQEEITQSAGEKLLVILRLKQPDNYLAAHNLLKKLSGKEYGARNYRAWSRWVRMENQQAPKTVI